MTFLKNAPGETLGGGPGPTKSLASSFSSSNFNWAMVTSEDWLGEKMFTSKAWFSVGKIEMPVLWGFQNVSRWPQDQFSPSHTVFGGAVIARLADLGSGGGGGDVSPKANSRYLCGMYESIYAYIDHIQVVDHAS